MLYRCDTSRIEPGLRDHDRLLVRDNTHDNVGFGAGANDAAAQGDDPLICFVNPDGDLTTECLNRLEAAMTDPDVVAGEPDFPGRNRERLPNGDMDWLSGACLVVRRAAFEAVGGFDGRLFMYAEDIDLSYKLTPLGRLVHVSEASFNHRTDQRPFISLHRHSRNYLVVQRRHRVADPRLMLRDALAALQRRELKLGVARLSGVLDYALRARYWA